MMSDNVAIRPNRLLHVQTGVTIHKCIDLVQGHTCLNHICHLFWYKFTHFVTILSHLMSGHRETEVNVFTELTKQKFYLFTVKYTTHTVIVLTSIVFYWQFWIQGKQSFPVPLFLSPLDSAFTRKKRKETLSSVSRHHLWLTCLPVSPPWAHCSTPPLQLSQGPHLRHIYLYMCPQVQYNNNKHNGSPFYRSHFSCSPEAHLQRPNLRRPSKNPSFE